MVLLVEISETIRAHDEITFNEICGKFTLYALPPTHVVISKRQLAALKAKRRKP